MTESADCIACGRVYRESWARDVTAFRCGAPGEKLGRVVDVVATKHAEYIRHIPAPAWCPIRRNINEKP